MNPVILESPSDRYRIEREYARGGMGITFLAVSGKTGRRCILKQLRLEKVNDWKVVELFEREAEILRQLNHPNIPSYIDYFVSERERHFNLVQTFIDGRTMQECIDKRSSVTPSQFSEYLRQALEILEYLHSLIPPVIHRDITPKNMILQDDKLFLVDFGSVKDAVNPRSARGSTVVGTFGYMPPEQFIGHAEPASDLYGLGMSFTAFASHKDPFQMVDPELGRVEVKTELDHLPGHIKSLLKDMTVPSLPDRFKSASEARRRLLHPESHRTPADVPLSSAEDQAEMNKSKAALLIFIVFFLIAGMIALIYTVRLRESKSDIAVYVPPAADLEIKEASAVRGIASANEKKLLAVALTDQLVIRDAEKGDVIKKISYDSIKPLSLKPDMFTGGKIFFTSDDLYLVMISWFSGRAYWWNTPDWRFAGVTGLPEGTLMDVKPADDQSCSALIFNENKSRLSVIRFTQKTIKTVYQLKLRNVALGAVDSASEKIAYALKDDSVVTVFDLVMQEKAMTYFSRGPVKSLQIDNRGEFLFWRAEREWNIFKIMPGAPVLTGETGDVLQGLTRGTDMTLSPDGKWFAHYEKSFIKPVLTVYSVGEHKIFQKFYPDDSGLVPVYTGAGSLRFLSGCSQVALSEYDKISIWNIIK